MLALGSKRHGGLASPRGESRWHSASRRPEEATDTRWGRAPSSARAILAASSSAAADLLLPGLGFTALALGFFPPRPFPLPGAFFFGFTALRYEKDTPALRTGEVAAGGQ